MPSPLALLLLSACNRDEVNHYPQADRTMVLRHFDLAPDEVLSGRISAAIMGEGCWSHARVEVPADSTDTWLRDLEPDQITATEADFARDLEWAPWWQPAALTEGRNWGEGKTIHPRIYRRVLVASEAADGRLTVWMERYSAGPCPA